MLLPSFRNCTNFFYKTFWLSKMFWWSVSFFFFLLCQQLWEEYKVCVFIVYWVVYWLGISQNIQAISDLIETKQHFEYGSATAWSRTLTSVRQWNVYFSFMLDHLEAQIKMDVFQSRISDFLTLFNCLFSIQFHAFCCCASSWRSSHFIRNFCIKTVLVLRMCMSQCHSGNG